MPTISRYLLGPKRSVGDQNPWLVLMASCFYSFLVALDITSINVALPSIQREFNVGLLGASWIINAGGLSFASLVIVGGKFGDIFGRKRLIIIGSFLFVIGCVAGIFALDIYFVIASRVIQGIGLAMVMPGALSIISNAFRKNNLSFAIGVWGSVGAVGFVFGPIIGGGLIEIFSWRLIFLLNLLIVLLCMVLIGLWVRESRDTTIGRSVDYVGVVLSAAAVFLLVLGILWTNVDGWTSPTVILFLVMGILSAACFYIVEKKSKFPLIEMGLFADRALVIGCIGRFSAGFAFLPVIFMSILYIQTFLHKDAFQGGMMILPVGLVVIASTIIWGKIIDQIGPRIPMVIGLSVAAFASLLWFRLDANSGYMDILPSLLLAGFGGSAAFVTSTVIIVRSLGVDRSGVASGIVNMIQNVSGSLGIAAASSLFLASLRSGLEDIGAIEDYERLQTFGPMIGDVVQAEIFAGALSYGALVVGVILFLGAVAAWFLPKDTARYQTKDRVVE